MGNRLKDIFSPDSNKVEQEIKRILNQAYNNQWCTSCKHSYFKNNDSELWIKCRISEDLCKERRWSSVDDSEQYCLFYEARVREDQYGKK